MTINRLLVAAALAYGVPGLALTFGPDEVLSQIGASASPVALWGAQLLGAALLGLAFLNWLQRYTLMGGIYGRPLLLANLTFVTVAFFASLHAWKAQGGVLVPAASVAFGLLLFAFGRCLFRTPESVKAAPSDGSA